MGGSSSLLFTFAVALCHFPCHFKQKGMMLLLLRGLAPTPLVRAPMMRTYPLCE
jgi:hypothetical protein